MQKLQYVLFIFFALICYTFCENNAEAETKAASYLVKYGYLTSANNQSDSLLHGYNLTYSLKAFQAKYGLKVTGKADKETIDLMNLARCGVHDELDSGNTTRKKRYALHGSKWMKTNITYLITKYPTSSLDRSTVDLEISRALKVWSDVTSLRFTHTTGTADIDIVFADDYHGDPNVFDGPRGNLAHAFYPQFGGDAHFDNAEDWTTTENGINFFQTATHEFGHSLGLLHSDVDDSIMAPFYRGSMPQLQLHRDDLDALAAIYGPPPGGYITNPPTYQAHTGTSSNNPSRQPIAVNEETAVADPPAQQPQGYGKPQYPQASYPSKNANTPSSANEKPISPSNGNPQDPNRLGNGPPLYPSGQNPVPKYPKQPLNPQSLTPNQPPNPVPKYPKQPLNPQSLTPNQSPNNSHPLYPSGSNPQPQYPKQPHTPNNNGHPLYPSGANPIPQYPKQPMKPKPPNPNQIPATPNKPTNGHPSNSHPVLPHLSPKYPDHGGKRPNANPGSLPDICKDSSIDAVTRTADGNTYAFKDEHYYRLTNYGYDSSYPRLINEDWGIDGRIDAALTSSRGYTYVFQGAYYWQYVNRRPMAGYPRLISSHFRGIPNNVDTAFEWSGDTVQYFITKIRVWRYFRTWVDYGHPRLPGRVDAAFKWTNGRTYFFSGTQYYRLNERDFVIDAGYPRDVGQWWFGCPSPPIAKSAKDPPKFIPIGQDSNGQLFFHEDNNDTVEYFERNLTAYMDFSSSARCQGDILMNKFVLLLFIVLNCVYCVT